jgi:hypothetical protein
VSAYQTINNIFHSRGGRIRVPVLGPVCATRSPRMVWGSKSPVRGQKVCGQQPVRLVPQLVRKVRQ